PVQEWTLSRAQEHHMHAEQGMLGYDLPPQVAEAARGLAFAAPAELAVAAGQPGHWRLPSDHGHRLLRSEALIDANGAVVDLRPYADRNALDLAIGVGISVHEGQLFGWANQALGLFTAFSLLAMSVSGFVLWRRRKPEGVLGAPPTPADTRAGRVVCLIIFSLALVLPLLALSLLALALLEWGVLRHLPPARRWLGLRLDAS